MLTERAFESFKEFIETHIAYAKVEYGGVLHKAKIESRERLKDGRVALSISRKCRGPQRLQKYSCMILLISCGQKRPKQST